MKKITIMTMLLLVAVACNDQIKPEASVAPKEGITFFTASTEVNEEDAPDEVDSKTYVYYDIDGKKRYDIFWKDQDSISIHSGGNMYKYKATPTGEHSASAYFYPEQTDLVLTAESHCALYPYDESAVWDGNKVTFTIPETQVCVPSSFPYNPSVAYTTDNSLAFKNIGVLIRYSINVTSIPTIVFEAVGGEPLTGTVTVDCENPENITIVKGNSTLTLNGTNNKETNYVTILPGTYSKGIRIMLFSKDGYKSIRTSYPLELERNSRIELGTHFNKTDILAKQPFWGLTYKNAEGEWQTDSNKDTIQVEGNDYIYHSLACGLDVAFNQLHNGTGKCWNDYCDPNGTLDDKAANLTLENVPENPCPEGWNLPTYAQLQILDREADNNTIQSDYYRYCYWKLKDGSLAAHNSIFGSNGFQLMSSELAGDGKCHTWSFSYNAEFVMESFITGRDRTYEKNTVWFRCVRNTPQE